MTIDACQHTFEVLASTELPGNMAALRKSIQAPHRATKFAMPGRGVGGILAELGKAKDFSGLYVFLENALPIYVGISRGVIGRIRQHLTGTTHYDATLAFRMAQLTSPKVEGLKQRKLLMKNEIFLQHFEKAEKDLAALSVAFVEIANPVELYIFEVYAAMALDTAKWNSFRTH